MNTVYKAAFNTVRWTGAALGDLGTRGPLPGICEALAKKVYPANQYVWFRNRWGHELHLSSSYHIDRGILAQGTYDWALHNAIERRVKPGMICLDAGANLGEMTLHMASKVRPGGAVYSFEPVPHVHKRLASHVARNGLGSVVRAFEVALTNADGPVDMAFADPDADQQGLGSIVNTNRDGLSQKSRVQGWALDSFVSEHGISRLDFMKVDIQGGEWFLLEGGAKVFSRMGPDLLMEISPFDLVAIGKDSRQLAQLIESYGYTIYTLRLDGMPVRRLSAASLDPGFSAQNVLCTKRAPAT